MLDPSAPGRLEEMLNEHVHNYFVNIFARGGFFQFLLFCFFYSAVIIYWVKNIKTMQLFYIYFNTVEFNT